MDTTATIPTGSMAERWKWKSFVGWGLFCGAIYYPLFGAWTWGGGWLSQLGNNAGPRPRLRRLRRLRRRPRDGRHRGAGRRDRARPAHREVRSNGKSRTLAGHHIPMAMLGTFILLFGWFGFNAASTLAATDVQFATVATNTAHRRGVRRDDQACSGS